MDTKWNWRCQKISFLQGCTHEFWTAEEKFKLRHKYTLFPTKVFLKHKISWYQKQPLTSNRDIGFLKSVLNYFFCDLEERYVLYFYLCKRLFYIIVSCAIFHEYISYSQNIGFNEELQMNQIKKLYAPFLCMWFNCL